MTRVLFVGEQGALFYIEDPSPPQELKRQIIARTWNPNVRLPWEGKPISVDIQWDSVLVGPKFPFDEDVELPISGFTRREQEVIQALADGCEYKEIGQQLCISPRTVKSYVATLKAKLNADTVPCAVARAVALGLCTPKFDKKR